VDLEQATLVDLVVASDLVGSRSEARRHIREGAVRVNDTVLKDEAADVEALLKEAPLKVSLGKKKHAFLKR
jgi:tyrosyl-tRNA synthetase